MKSNHQHKEDFTAFLAACSPLLRPSLPLPDSQTASTASSQITREREKDIRRIEDYTDLGLQTQNHSNCEHIAYLIENYDLTVHQDEILCNYLPL